MRNILGSHRFLESQKSLKIVSLSVECAIIRETEITEIHGEDEVTGVTLSDGRHISCDMRCFAFSGIVHPTEWLKWSGMTLNRGIITNEYLKTPFPTCGLREIVRDTRISFLMTL